MSQQISSDIVSRITRVLGKPTTPIQLHEPEFRGNEWNYLKECLDTGWVSTVGKFVDRFEKNLSEATQTKFAVAAVNGTAALQVAFRVVGVEQNDEVLMPALTFIATANAASYLGAIPHFVDVDRKTLGVDPSKLEQHLGKIAELKNRQCFNRNTGRRIKALAVMHTFGHPADLDRILEICNRYSLELVEDAAEALGSEYNGKHVGQHGRIATLSFNGNKVVTTGGGGALITNDGTLAARAKHLTTTAREKHTWEFRHDEIGYNFRMPNINAALGCAQLEKLPQFLNEKRALAKRYVEAFADCKVAKAINQPSNSKSNFWFNAIEVTNSTLELRDQILADTNKAGFATRPVWVLMHHLVMYKDNPRADLTVSEQLERSIINLPSSPVLGRALT